MELNILYFIQGMHTPVLDNIFVALFNTMVGSLGQMWIIVGVVLTVIPKTRKCGISVLTAYLLSLVIGDLVLKDLIARPRPCAVDETVALIVKRPGSFSCPSVHTYFAFSSAMAIFCHYKKAGIATFIFAAFVGFSRLYFFVHYPTDVLFGAVLGVVTGWLACALIKQISAKLTKSK